MTLLPLSCLLCTMSCNVSYSPYHARPTFSLQIYSQKHSSFSSAVNTVINQLINQLQPLVTDNLHFSVSHYNMTLNALQGPIKQTAAEQQLAIAIARQLLMVRGGGKR